MFQVHHVNFGTVQLFATLGEARAWTVKAAFEAAIYDGVRRIATYSPISGWRTYVS